MIGPKLRYARFVVEYVRDGNATRSAVAAGYSPATAHAQGHRLLGRPAIAAAIDTIAATRSTMHTVYGDCGRRCSGS